jgi:ethanolamine ammonia-lyase small subunit
MSDHDSDPFIPTEETCHRERGGTTSTAVAAPQPHLSSRPKPSKVEGSEAPATPKNQHPLSQLTRFTPARIALGRTGNSLPTKELLDFNLAHALARDAIHTEFDADSIIEQLTTTHLQNIQIKSAAADRTTYLRRPDLGRRLSEESREHLFTYKPQSNPELLFIVADGLSAMAPIRYAVPVIEATRGLINDWKIGPVILAEQARVAIGDEIGEILQARITVVLIGERPGLSSPDSLGIYLTYNPRVG